MDGGVSARCRACRSAAGGRRGVLRRVGLTGRKGEGGGRLLGVFGALLSFVGDTEKWFDEDCSGGRYCSMDCFTDNSAIDPTISACRFPFRRPRKLWPCLSPCCEKSLSGDGARIEVAAARAVDKAVDSDPPASNMDLAAVMACAVACDNNSASSVSDNRVDDLPRERFDI
jgi:hypothetical protein